MVSLWLAGGVWACEAPPSTMSPERMRLLAQIPYPKDSAVDDLDIVVVQEQGEIILTNRTAWNYAKTQLWLNQQYVGFVEQVPIGAATRFQLVDFVNKYGEPFLVGGILTPDKTDSVVLAELYTTQDPFRADATDMKGGGSSKRYRLLLRHYHD